MTLSMARVGAATGKNQPINDGCFAAACAGTLDALRFL